MAIATSIFLSIHWILC